MGKTPVEKLEAFRNLRFRMRMRSGRQPELYIGDIEKICGATVSREADRTKRISFIGFFNEFDDVYGKDCLYVHLPHDPEKVWLAKRAVNHGALAVVSERQIEDLPCIVVEDVWHVLKELSRLYLDGWSGSSVAIAGSIGKTTTKEMVESVMKQSFRTFCTPNNGNVLSYLSFEIQHMPRNVEQFVQEVDESYPNNAADCSYVLQPNIAIITTIDNSHVGALGGEDAVEKAILDVTAYMPQDSTVIISADDPKSKAAVIDRNVVSIGIKDQNADCTASEIVSDGKSVDFTVTYGGEKCRLHLNCPGEHNVYNAMFAFVAGKLNGISSRKIQRGLSRYKPMTIRQNTYHAFGKTLYVDCFNASAKSVCAALEVLRKKKPGRNGRRIAVLGDIAEIEGFEEQTYRKIAEKIAELKGTDAIDMLITYGPESEQIRRFLGDAVPSGCNILEESELVSFIRRSFRRGDVILFKASHSMRMEYVIEKAFPLTYNLAVAPFRMKTFRWLLKTI